MPKRVPPPMSQSRIAEARKLATASNWFAGCPELRCQAQGRCSGALRPFEEEGPRCYPTCFHLALTALLDPEGASESLRDAADTLFEADPSSDSEDGPESEAADLLNILLILSKPRPEALH